MSDDRVNACPKCDSTITYCRKTKRPPWRCGSCGEEFTEPVNRERKTAENGPPESAGRRMIPDSELIADLQRVGDLVSSSPTIADYRHHGEFSYATYRNRFGSWNEALGAADITPTYTKPDTDELCEDIQRVAQVVDGTPTSSEYDERGEYPISTINRRFGSWSNAVEAAGLTAHSVGSHGTVRNLSEINPEDIGLSPLGERS